MKQKRMRECSKEGMTALSSFGSSQTPLFVILLERVVHELRGKHGNVGRRTSGLGTRHKLRRHKDELGSSSLGNVHDLLIRISKRALKSDGQVLGLLILIDGTHFQSINRLASRAASLDNSAHHTNQKDREDANSGKEGDLAEGEVTSVVAVVVLMMVALKGAFRPGTKHGFANRLS